MSDNSDCLLIVKARVEPDVEAAWNQWYDNVHLPEILECPGFISGTRYVAETDDGRDYLTIYDLESPGAAESSKFSARRGWAEFRPNVTASVQVFRKVPEGSKTDD